MSRSPLILGLDQGTTSTRACLMDRRGRTVAEAQLAHQQFRPKPGWVEHDASEIWQNSRRLILDVVARRPRRSTVVAMGIANPGETVLLWDRETGSPLGRAIVWQDTRTQRQMDRLAADSRTAQLLRRRTGLRADGYFSASKVRWLLTHSAEASRLAKAGRLCAGTIDTWLIWKLTGGEQLVTDVSTAARTLLFDIRSLRYDPELLSLFRVPRAILPEVRQSAAAFGELRGFGPALDGVPIVASLVDQPAAMLGLGCLEPGQVKATYGTGCFVYLNTGSRVSQEDSGLLSTIAWQRDGRVSYALDGGIFAAGAVLEWLKDGLKLLKRPQDLEGMLARAPAFGEVLCVPALAGLAVPHWKRNARAAWLGMGLDVDRNQLVRSAMEGVAARVVEVVETMERAYGMRIPSLLVDGGLTKSAGLMQIQADLLGRPVRVSANPEATLFGACALAARAIGLWKTDAEIKGRVTVSRVFRPRLRKQQRQRFLTRFNAALTLIGERVP